MTIKSRIQKLETVQGMGRRMKYMCVITDGWANGWVTPEEKAKGYKIQPFIRSAGGTGGEPFYLATDEELEAFAARPDVDLMIIKVGYASDANKARNTPV